MGITGVSPALLKLCEVTEFPNQRDYNSDWAMGTVHLRAHTGEALQGVTGTAPHLSTLSLSG